VSGFDIAGRSQDHAAFQGPARREEKGKEKKGITLPETFSIGMPGKACRSGNIKARQEGGGEGGEDTLIAFILLGRKS